VTRQKAGRKGEEKMARERVSEFFREIYRNGGESRGNRNRSTET
jgi:hypothetical protein